MPAIADTGKNCQVHLSHIYLYIVCIKLCWRVSILNHHIFIFEVLRVILLACLQVGSVPVTVSLS